MLLLMIERGIPIDMVLVADTGMEFPEMYQHWDKVEQYLYQKRGLKLTILRSTHSFEWLMFDQPKQKPSALERRLKEGVPPLWERLAQHEGAMVYRPTQSTPNQQGIGTPKSAV